jgi:microcystin-dependent protein
MTQITLGQIVADFETSLATAMAVGATSATLLSADYDDFVEIPPGRYFLTIDGNNSSKEHISCDLNAEALTNIKTLSRQGTETAGCVRPHRVGAKVVLTDFAHIKKINDLLDGTTDFDPSVVLAYSGTANISSDHQLATKLYVDTGILQGAADAGKTTKGIAFLSTGPASATGPIAVGDNDVRVSPVSLASLTTGVVAALVGNGGTASSGNKYVTEVGGFVYAPVGMISPYSGTTAPSGWLIADGSTVSQTTYAALYAITGHTFGTDPGSGNFILPNLKGRIPVGIDSATFASLGATGGEEKHQLSISEMPAHDHPGSYAVYPSSGTKGPAYFESTSAQTGNVVSQGGTASHNNLQPYIALNYIIKY